jgi:hypothetical protein
MHVLSFMRMAAITLTLVHASAEAREEPANESLSETRRALLDDAAMARTEYTRTIDSLRRTLVDGIDREIANARARAAAGTGDDSLLAELKQARAECDASRTSVAASPRLRALNQAYEIGAREARDRCRTAVGTIVEKLRDHGAHVDAESVLEELERVCPPCVELRAFVRAVAQIRREMHEVVSSKKTGVPMHGVVDALDRLYGAARSDAISAEDLTRELRALLAQIEATPAFRTSGQGGRKARNAFPSLVTLHERLTRVLAPRQQAPR